MSEIKVGDTLWTTPYGRPERVGDESDVITGETTQSWLLGGFKRAKVNKKTLLEAIPRMTPRQWYTEQGKADYLFMRAHRHQISAAVLSCRNVDKLKKIAEVIGMELK